MVRPLQGGLSKQRARVLSEPCSETERSIYRWFGPVLVVFGSVFCPLTASTTTFSTGWIVPTASLTALQSLVPVTHRLPELRGYAATSLASATTRSAGRPSPICRIPPASLARMIRSSLPTRSLPGPRGGRGVVCLPRLFGAATTDSPTPIARR